MAHTLDIKFVEQLEDGPCQLQILGGRYQRLTPLPLRLSI